MPKMPLWRLTTLRRKMFEALGSSRYSRPGFPQLLEGLIRHIPSPGFFVEAGAVDGVFESNTYYLERFLGWQGILIEPVPEMFQRLKTNRPKARSFHCALVADSQVTPTVAIDVHHAMSQVVADPNRDEKATESILIPGKTLTWVLKQANPKQWDLLSLDVEGYEIQVLKGLDFDQYQPRFLLIECLTEESLQDIKSFLPKQYQLIEQLSYRDYLFSNGVKAHDR